MSKSRRRTQASKRDRALGMGNLEMGMAFVELRKGSRTSPHRDRSKYERNDFRRDSQKGFAY